MGYHRRALAVHRAALEIVERFGGVVPDDEASLRSLPGIGPYTARAVLAFAYEHDVAVVDTNVARILARAIAGESLTQRTAQTLADSLVVPGTGWAHNQAMLDFGALTCRAEPRCHGCALRRSCRWASTGFVEPDPARTTAGTSRSQAPFKGSDREVRGQLLARARASAPRAASLDGVTATFGHARVQRLVDALVADGLIVRRGERVALK
jgi:A/G-specific adenine glycosylase